MKITLTRQDIRAIVDAAERAIIERQGYMQDGWPDKDYGDEWPAASETMACEFDRIAELLIKLGRVALARRAADMALSLRTSGKQYTESR